VPIPRSAAGEPAFRPTPQPARRKRLLLWDYDLRSIERRQATLRQAARNLGCSFRRREESAEKPQPVRDEGAACSTPVATGHCRFPGPVLMQSFPLGQERLDRLRHGPAH